MENTVELKTAMDELVSNREYVAVRDGIERVIAALHGEE